MLAVLVPLGVVTATLSPVPAAWAAVMAVICVALLTVKFTAAVPPKLTPVAPVKPAPVMVMTVPPAVLPLVELRLATVGGAR